MDPVLTRAALCGNRTAGWRGPFHPSRARVGFSLIELVVALVLLSIGLLGVVSTTTLVAQMTGDGAQRTLASRVAQTVVDSLAVVPCAALSDGTTSYATVRVDYAVADTGAMRDVVTTVTYHTRHGERTATLRSLLTCPAP